LVEFIHRENEALGVIEASLHNVEALGLIVVVDDEARVNGLEISDDVLDVIVHDHHAILAVEPCLYCVYLHAAS
jgi:hypothetical protein